MDADQEAQAQAQLYNDAKDVIREQAEVLDRLMSAPWTHATVVAHSANEDKNTLIVADTSGVFEVLSPEKIAVEGGDIVRLNGGKQVVNVACDGGGHGSIVTVAGEPKDGLCEVEVDGQARMVHLGKIEEAEVGDRLILDQYGVVATVNMGHEETRFRFDAVTGVSWDDIGGLQDAKMAMVEAVELPHRHPEVFEFYGKRPANGILLYGPPGCGKTMIGKATASAIANIYGKENGGFFYVKGPEILSMWVGRSEQTIRELFDRARRFKDEHGYPAVIFLDEADALLGRRGDIVGSAVDRTIVPMFLTEMDGLHESGAIVLMATNREDTLDPAVIREGRVDRKIRISRPDAEATREIFSLYLEKIPMAKGISVEEMAEVGRDQVFDMARAFNSLHTAEGVQFFTLANIIHGGMIASIVDQATSNAMHRDLAAGKGKKGMVEDDLIFAVERAYVENHAMDHTQALEEFAEPWQDIITGVKKLPLVEMGD